MERVPCWPLTNREFVCSYCCVCDWPYSKLLLVFDRWSMGPHVCNFTSCMRHFAFRIHRNVNNVLPCIDLRWLNVWHGCRVDAGRTESTFVAIAVCAIDLTRRCYWCSMQHRAVCNFTSFMRHFAFRIHRNVNNGLALIFVDWMYGTRVGPGQAARTFVAIAVCVCDWPYSKVLLVFDAVWGRM